METLGSILDKICILERRIRAYQEEGKETWSLYEQYGWLLKELGEILNANFSGERPFKFGKNKLYDKDVTLQEDLSLLESLDSLNDTTNKLWAIEDKRRDKTLSPEERLVAADLVSINNKIRNDSIDRIDQNVERAARASHPQLFEKRIKKAE